MVVNCLGVECEYYCRGYEVDVSYGNTKGVLLKDQICIPRVDLPPREFCKHPAVYQPTKGGMNIGIDLLKLSKCPLNTGAKK